MIRKGSRKVSSGFTLIELMIVVSILGVLSGVLLNVLRPEHFRDKSRDSIRMSNVRKIAEAAESYSNLEGGYAGTEAILSGSNYIANWPDGEPTSSDDYVYTSAATSFVVYVVSSDNGTYVFDSAVGKLQKCDAALANCTSL